MQRDYWKMSEEELTKLALRYRIPHQSASGENEWPETYFDRERVISALVARDTARRAGWSLLLSVFALLISFAALGVSLVNLSLK